jgi:predicted pyridoxine 5'-phosphate oxidase superfamily flavin-nucleotide-binding protein
MTDFVTDAAHLQDCVGRLPGPRDMKVIDHLDAHALRWLAASPLLFAGIAGQRLALSAGSGAPGFARGDSPHLLSLPLQALDTAHTHVGAGFGSLFLVPGLGETLRINGRIAGEDGARLFVAVEECYLHCAKALLRADWWRAEAQADATPPQTPERFLADCRLLILVTADAQGRVDVSPRGDRAGALLQAHRGAWWFADRPGNRRVDSLGNLLARPQIALLALRPGSARCVRIEGLARPSTDAAIRAALAVDGRVPHLAVRVLPAVLEETRSAALDRFDAWPPVAIAHDLDPPTIFRDHVRLSGARGAQATLMRAAVSVPGLVRKGLQADYKKNMY